MFGDGEGGWVGGFGWGSSRGGAVGFISVKSRPIFLSHSLKNGATYIHPALGSRPVEGAGMGEA